jgi:hypothetical protein
MNSTGSTLPLGANAKVFRVASGALAGAPWWVDVASSDEGTAVSIVSGSDMKLDMGNGPLGWIVQRTKQGTWLYGAVPTEVKRMTAVLESGTALTGCPIALPPPVSQGWFALAIPAGDDFKIVEGLAADDHIILWATISGSAGTVTPALLIRPNPPLSRP